MGSPTNCELSGISTATQWPSHGVVAGCGVGPAEEERRDCSVASGSMIEGGTAVLTPLAGLRNREQYKRMQRHIQAARVTARRAAAVRQRSAWPVWTPSVGAALATKTRSPNFL